MWKSGKPASRSARLASASTCCPMRCGNSPRWGCRTRWPRSPSRHPPSPTTTSLASRSGTSRAAWPPATPGRSSRCIAGSSRCCCTRRQCSAWARTAFMPAMQSNPSPRWAAAGRASLRASCCGAAATAPPSRPKRTCWWAPTASTRPCAGISTPPATRRASPAACSGAPPPRPRPTSTAVRCSWPAIRTRSSSLIRSPRRCTGRAAR
ncbi:hypothetical protein D3C87_1315130 [compost metagenome]